MLAQSQFGVHTVLSVPPRYEWLGSVKSDRATKRCYIASSRKQGEPDTVVGYRLARSGVMNTIHLGSLSYKSTSHHCSRRPVS